MSQPEDDGSGAGTISRSGVPNIPGAEDVMSEMTRRLRERRAKAENNTQVSEQRWWSISFLCTFLDYLFAWIRSSHGSVVKATDLHPANVSLRVVGGGRKDIQPK